MRNRWWIGPGLAAAALTLAACGTSGSGTDPAPAAAAAAGHSNTGADPVAIKTMSTRKGTVLVNAQGRTLYWFAKDTSTKSRCNGSCTTYWPPVLGKATAAGTSLPHGFGTIKRSDGKTQVTYDGHPLYTYAGDTAVGQLNGNGLNASGGLWWAITPSGSELTAKTTSSGSGSSGSSGSSSSGSSGSSGGGGW
jgi:predicted lipoprotein with Yx(FWY)xxD motif